MAQSLTHIDEKGSARMVDIAEKQVSKREATAQAFVTMQEETLQLLTENKLPKGDVFQVARVAGILAAKKTWELIPLCHPIPISSVTIEFETVLPNQICILAKVKNQAKTGVEMEALTAASVTALTVYDMAKAVDPGMEISNIQVCEKKGGKRGHWTNPAGSNDDTKSQQEP